MAVQIPIISDFDGKGVQKAIAQFKQLETTGQKAQFALKKAAVPAAAALAGITAGLVDATKAAIEDQASQRELARSLEITAGATDKQIKSVEDWISTQGRLLGVADDQLRPALAKLSRATYDIETAQTAATLAMDIAAGTGKDLDTVTTALAKAYGGNLTALQKIDPSLRDMIKGGASLSDVLDVLGGKFGGAATVAANTAEGGFKRLKLSLDETKESIGASLLPIVEKALPKLNEFAAWAQNNPDTFRNIAAGIAAVAASIVLTNAALSTNPFVLMAGGATALVLAFDKVAQKIEEMNKLAGFGARLVGYLLSVGKLGDVFKYFPTLGNEGGNKGGGGKLAVPAMAAGGIVTAPTLALVGEAGPEAVVPLDRMGGMGGNQVTINVNGGDPNAVVDALRRYMRTNGAVPIRVAASV